ncbi:hypothetical protein glysoja_041951, partial [Glycine soja]
FSFILSLVMATIDDSNPLIFHSFDNPGIALVSHPLTGENYNSWKKEMCMALHGKNKYRFVHGSILEPTLGHSTHALWHRNDSIVSSWLLNSLSKEMQVSILHYSFAKAIWDDLKERFEKHNGPLIFQLKHELITLQQGSMFVSSFYSKLHSLWESLSELKPSHSCTCGGIKPWCDFEQLEYAMQFLMELNESFSTIRG